MRVHPPLTRTRLITSLSVALVLMVLAILFGLSTGSSSLGGWDLLIDWLSGTLDGTRRTILLEARAPRVGFALAVGAALASAGAVFQAVLRNPLADPYILGVSGGAALGATLMLSVVGTSAVLVFSVPVAAFLGALGAIGLILAVSRWGPSGRMTTYVLLLTGVIFNAFASSVIMFLKAVVSAQKAQELLFYLMGTLSVEAASGRELAVVGGASLVCVLVLTWLGRDLNLMSLGDETASALGVDVGRVRAGAVVVSSLGVALAVAYTGLIGFVGLVVPHGIRLLVGPDHRLLLPLCAICGGAFLVCADAVARMSFGVMGSTLPVGVVTAFLGAPLFVLFLRRHLREEGAE